MKNFISIFIICTFLNACKKDKQVKAYNNSIFAVTADTETTPVTSFDDAADDPCIWINPKDASKSTIIGTNKQEGLEVYNLEGKRLYSYKIGRVNNVDIRNGFILNNKEVSVVTASNRTSNTIAILIVKPTGELEEIAARPIKSNLNEVYGLGMYKSTKTNKFYVFIVGKKGGIEQWELFENQTKIDAKLVRSFSIKSQGEGIVADDFYGYIYIGEEDNALWKFNAEPDADTNPKKILSTKDKNMAADFEGVTLYDSGNGKGYIIVSSQGNNTYAILDRETNQYIKSFSIKDAIIDGTYDTDGIDVCSVNLGKKYPEGIFIAQDGANTQDKDSLHQNFKIVDWRKIDKKLH